MSSSRIIKTGIAGLAAAAVLSGCMVSDNPAVNAAATSAVIGTAASLLFYNLSDGYYYDDNYNRMPRNYRPQANARIQRVDNIDSYRNRYPRMQQNDNRPQMQQRGGQQGGNSPQMQQHQPPQMQQDDRFQRYSY